jgi:hypothetical protein
LDVLLSEHLAAGAEEVPWPVVAAVLTIARFCETIVQAMEAKYGRADRIWVMDRGMVSEKNLAFLRERGGSYIVGTPKAMLRSFEQHITQKGWQEVQAGVEVKLVAGPDGMETFILARSADRREKERAMDVLGDQEQLEGGRAEGFLGKLPAKDLRLNLVLGAEVVDEGEQFFLPAKGAGDAIGHLWFLLCSLGSMVMARLGRACPFTAGKRGIERLSAARAA